MRRNFSLVARYLLKSTHCSLLVAKFARYSLQKLVVAKKSLVTRCSVVEIHLLLVAKLARYSLQKLLVANIHSFLVAKFACQSQQISVFIRCKIRPLLIAEVACCKKSLVTRCEIRLLLVAKNHSLLVANNHSTLVKTITS